MSDSLVFIQQNYVEFLLVPSKHQALVPNRCFQVKPNNLTIFLFTVIQPNHSADTLPASPKQHLSKRKKEGGKTHLSNNKMVLPLDNASCKILVYHLFYAEYGFINSSRMLPLQHGEMLSILKCLQYISSSKDILVISAISLCSFLSIFLQT